MKVLCFGDSNAWGYCPITGDRYDRPWPKVLQQLLGTSTIDIDTQPGRTTCYDGGPNELINGLVDFEHRWRDCDHDAVIIMLGTNDLQNRFSSSAMDVANNLAKLVKVVGYQRAWLCAPVPIVEKGRFGQLFRGAEAESQRLPEVIAELSMQLGCRLLDANLAVSANGIDGVHWLEKDHQTFAEYTCEQLRKQFGDSFQQAR